MAMANTRWEDIPPLPRVGSLDDVNATVEKLRQDANLNIRRALAGINVTQVAAPAAGRLPSPDPGSGAVQIKSAGIFYPDSVSRDLEDKLGETPSVLDWGAVGNGVTNDYAAFQAAIDATSATGRALRIPANYVFLVNSSLSLPANTVLVGDGPKSVIKRGATLATGNGLLDIVGSNVRLANFLIEGAVTTSVGLLYSDFSFDPVADLLTTNSSIWVHGPCSGLALDGVTIQHSGGYALFLDARTGRVSDVWVTRCNLVNNRPHLFGTSSGDRNYGSWTGGIFARGDGANYGVDNVVISDCSFRRGTGNQVWQHLPAFGRLHTNWRVNACHFEDIGRDAVLYGGLINGVVDGCTIRRIGYISGADSGATTPRYLANNWAVGIDTSGITVNCAYTNNVLTSCYGGCFDLDGFSQGVVAGNVCRTPEAGEIDYAEDSISSWSVPSYGVNLGDTSNNAGGRGVLVVGNRFKNLGAGAIRLYAWQDGYCTGNLVDHPAAAPIAPLTFGPGGAGGNQGCGNNVITGNTFLYAPSAAVACIQEDATLASFGGTKNHVFGNVVMGANAFEFLKSSTSTSITSFVLSTSSVSSVRSESVLQREGTGAAGALKLYSIDGGTSQQVAQLSHDAFLNVSVNGGAATGVVATGAITSLAWGNAVASGKLVATGFVAIQHYGDGSFSSSEANALDDTWGLIRFNKTTDQLEKSVTTSAGARVWIDISSGGGSAISVPGANKDVIFNDSGVLGAVSTLTWDKAAKLLTVTGTTGTAGIAVATAFIQSAEGFLTTSASSTAVNAAAGGVTALSLISVRNDGAAGLTLSRTSGTARTYGEGVDSGGQWYLRDQTAGIVRLAINPGTGALTTSNQVIVGGATSGAGLTVLDGYTESTEGFYSNFASFQTLQAPSGGVYARSLRAIAYTQVGVSFGQPAPTTGDGFAAGALYWDTGPNTLRVFNGSFWAALGGSAVTSVSGGANMVVSPTTGNVVVSLASSVTISLLALTGGGNALTLSSGFVQSAGGFVSLSSAFNSVQTIGGVLSSFGYYVGSGFGAAQVIDSARNLYVNTVKNVGGGDLINGFGQFVGSGVLVQGSGIGCGGVNIWNGSGYYFGQTQTYFLTSSGGGTVVLIFRGGVLTNI
jgi:hypothetical protein